MTTTNFDFSLGEKVEASFMGTITERAQAYDRNGRLINKYQIRIHGENRMVWLDGDYVFAPFVEPAGAANA